jgi:hypothetical protein
MLRTPLVGSMYHRKKAYRSIGVEVNGVDMKIMENVIPFLLRNALLLLHKTYT